MYTRVVWPSITFKTSDDWFPPVTYRFLFIPPFFFFLFLLANEESTIKLRDIIIKKKERGTEQNKKKIVIETEIGDFNVYILQDIEGLFFHTAEIDFKEDEREREKYL
jgi:hypothetical protein